MENSKLAARKALEDNARKIELQQEAQLAKAQQLAEKRRLAEQKALLAEEQREAKRTAYIEKKKIKEQKARERKLEKERSRQEKLEQQELSKALRDEAARREEIERNAAEAERRAAEAQRKAAEAQAKEQQRLRDEERRAAEAEKKAADAKRRVAEAARKALEDNARKIELQQEAQLAKAQQLAEKRRLAEQKALLAEEQREAKRTAYIEKKKIKEQKARERKLEKERSRQEKLEQQELSKALRDEAARREEIAIRAKKQKALEDKAFLAEQRQQAKRNEYLLRKKQRRETINTTTHTGELIRETHERIPTDSDSPISNLDNPGEGREITGQLTSNSPIERKVPISDFLDESSLKPNASAATSVQVVDRPQEPLQQTERLVEQNDTLRKTHPYLWEAVATFAQFSIVFAILVPCLLLNELWLTGRTTSSNQSSLLANFQHQIVQARKSQIALRQANPEPGLLPAPTQNQPPDGTPIAELRIPSIDTSLIVVQGISRSDLTLGPGHYPNTPLPGQAGNVVIAGHRVTYLHPFYYLDQLSKGQSIFLQTTGLDLKYIVTGVSVVTGNYSRFLDSTARDELTLTTANPKYESSSRLVITSVLKSVDGNPPFETTFHFSPNTSNTLSREENSLAGNTGPISPAVLLFILLCLCNLVIRQFARKLNPIKVYIIGAPIVLLVGFMLIGAINNALPATF